MSRITSKAKKLARTLLRENRRGRSWRDIAQRDFGGTVNYATLNKFARNKGAWIPKDVHILYALGLAEPKPPKPPRPPDPEWLKEIKKRIATMAKRTRQDLGLQK
jgi:hypothetical protein